MNIVNRWGVVIAALILTALGVNGARAQDSPLVAAIKAADEACNVARFRTHLDLASCYNSQERAVWAKFASQVLPYFEPYASARLNAASAVDSNATSLEAAEAEEARARETFRSQLVSLQAAETERQRASQQERQAQRDMDAGACEMYARSVSRPTGSAGYCRACGALDALTTIVSVRSAYNSCMRSKGWNDGR